MCGSRIHSSKRCSLVQNHLLPCRTPPLSFTQQGVFPGRGLAQNHLLPCRTPLSFTLYKVFFPGYFADRSETVQEIQRKALRGDLMPRLILDWSMLTAPTDRGRCRTRLRGGASASTPSENSMSLSETWYWQVCHWASCFTLVELVRFIRSLRPKRFSRDCLAFVFRSLRIESRMMTRGPAPVG